MINQMRSLTQPPHLSLWSYHSGSTELLLYRNILELSYHLSKTKHDAHAKRMLSQVRIILQPQGHCPESLVQVQISPISGDAYR